MKQLFVVLAAAAAAGFLFLRPATGANVAPGEARHLVEQGALLLDVRTPQEFAAGHLDGAVNIPVQQLEARLSELAAKKDRPIVVYCRSGARSASAAKLLAAAGHSRVFDLGAMSSWKRPGATSRCAGLRG